MEWYAVQSSLARRARPRRMRILGDEDGVQPLPQPPTFLCIIAASISRNTSVHKIQSEDCPTHSTVPSPTALTYKQHAPHIELASSNMCARDARGALSEKKLTAAASFQRRRCAYTSHRILPTSLHVAAIHPTAVSRASRRATAASAARPTTSCRHQKIDGMPLAQLGVPLQQPPRQTLANSSDRKQRNAQQRQVRSSHSTSVAVT